MIRVGTCSWAEKSLINSGEFYPKTVKSAEARLRFYAEHFDTVEVDSTYYAIPTKSNAALWADRTPPEFIFHVKVYGALTGHAVDQLTLPREVLDELPEQGKDRKQVYVSRPKLVSIIADRFAEALQPLARSGKLGALVFQFPPWLIYKPESLEFILARKELLERYQMAAEFRHGSWYAPKVRERVFRFLRENGIIHVVADEPQYGTLATVPFVQETTADTAYYRLHGRNRENWLKRGIETSLRYAYDYSAEELQEFVPHVQESAKAANGVYVMFNNCHGSSAARNALTMKKMLKA